MQLSSQYENDILEYAKFAAVTFEYKQRLYAKNAKFAVFVRVDERRRHPQIASFFRHYTAHAFAAMLQREHASCCALSGVDRSRASLKFVRHKKFAEPRFASPIARTSLSALLTTRFASQVGARSTRVQICRQFEYKVRENSLSDVAADGRRTFARAVFSRSFEQRRRRRRRPAGGKRASVRKTLRAARARVFRPKAALSGFACARGFVASRLRPAYARSRLRSASACAA